MLNAFDSMELQEYPPWGRGVLASWIRMTRDFSHRVTDAAHITFPIQFVIVIAGVIVATSGAYWLANYQIRSDMQAIRSDMRDIKTTMDDLTRYQSAQIDAVRRDYEDLRREQALQKIRLEETRNTLAELKGFLTASGIKGAVK